MHISTKLVVKSPLLPTAYQAHKSFLKASQLPGELTPQFEFPFFSYRSAIGSITEGDVPNAGPPMVGAIVAYSKGFACSGGKGIVHLYEKTEDKDFYKKTREIKVCGYFE